MSKTAALGFGLLWAMSVFVVENAAHAFGNQCHLRRRNYRPHLLATLGYKRRPRSQNRRPLFWATLGYEHRPRYQNRRPRL